MCAPSNVPPLFQPFCKQQNGKKKKKTSKNKSSGDFSCRCHCHEIYGIFVSFLFAVSPVIFFTECIIFLLLVAVNLPVSPPLNVYCSRLVHTEKWECGTCEPERNSSPLRCVTFFFLYIVRWCTRFRRYFNCIIQIWNEVIVWAR